uniref:Peptidase_M14 domain-containing protein n=1 Tax=Steinernema glaseri TaxID=37863 RepID=A0A1I7ZJM4_9BILA
MLLINKSCANRVQRQKGHYGIVKIHRFFRALRDFFLNVKIDGYVNLHAFGAMIITPFNSDNETMPDDIDELIRVGQQMALKAGPHVDTAYRVGTSVTLLNYSSSGSLVDWAKLTANVKYSYAIELPPGKLKGTASDVSFQPPTSKLMSIARSAWEAVKVVMQAVVDYKEDPIDMSLEKILNSV